MSFARFMIVLSLSWLLWGCGGGGSYVGDQTDVPPIAAATVEGLGKGVSGTFSARAGTDVLITGKNSDGVDDPLLQFDWRQVSGTPVTLFERGSASRSFTVPDVADTLEFELTVTDTDGVTASDRVTIDVAPVADADAFLRDPGVAEEFFLFVAADSPASSSAVGAASVSEVAATVAYHLSVTPIVHWVDRSGTSRSQALDPVTTIDDALDAGFVIPADPVDVAQDHFAIAVPRLDADLVNRFYQGSERPGRLEPEAVGDAWVELVIDFTPAAPGDFEVLVARRDGSAFETLRADALVVDPDTASTADGAILSGQAGSARIDLEKLRDELRIESSRSASNYYACIDPDGRAATLSGWLAQAGFDGDTDEVHAAYTNNYDLGFGRDMHLRRDDEGNVYSYVINYPGLESLLKGQGEFATVAMEYSAAPQGTCDAPTFDPSHRIVKFYAFVPDRTTGEMVRAGSMNFDGRGERFLPGVCTACHDGSVARIAEFDHPDLASIDAANADLSASFMPWDLDSFLYTDARDPDLVDPSFTRSEFSDEEVAAYSRESQEDAFRAMNETILSTFVADLRRYGEPLRLIHGWYGDESSLPPRIADDPATDTDESDDPTLPSPLEDVDVATLTTVPDQPFDGSYVQEGWAGQEQLYRDVFERHCRMCHTQQDNLDKNFESYDEFIHAQSLVRNVFERGVMPAARLTMDRFWVDFHGGDTSAGELLKAHLNAAGAADIALDEVPGRPVADVVAAPTRVTSMDGDGEIVPTTISLDASASLYSDEFFWTVTADSGCPAVPEVFGATSPVATFVADASPCVYDVALQTANGLVTSNASARIAVDRAPGTVDFGAPLNGYTPGDGFVDVAILDRIPSSLDGDGGLRLVLNEPAEPFGLVVSDDVSDLGDGRARISFPPLAGISQSFQYKVEDMNGTVSPGLGIVSVSVPQIRPSSLNPTDITPTGFTLQWSVPAGFVADGYKVYRDGPDPDGTFAPVASTSTVSFADSGLVSGGSYAYRVTALLGVAESNPSDSVNVTLAVGIPQALTAGAASTTSILLSWSAGIGTPPDSYTVYRDGSAVTTTTATSFTDVGLTQNTSHVYRVSQTVGGAESDLSAAVTAATDSDAPSSAVATPTDGTSSSISVSWQAPLGGGAPSGYRLTRDGVTEVATTTATTFDDTGLSPYTTHSYQIESIGLNGASTPTSAGSATTYPSFAANIAPRRTTGEGFTRVCADCHGAAVWEDHLRVNTPGCVTDDTDIGDCNSSMPAITATQEVIDLLTYWGDGGKLD